MAWQQISIAHMQAVRENRGPRLPSWLGGADPVYAEDPATEFNARILELHSMDSWASVHQAWQDGFCRSIGLAEDVPEHRLLDAEKCPWLGGDPPLAVITGSCEHHEEHLNEASATIK
jgi:hypothetical protein